VINALLGLGYSDKEAQLAVKHLPEGLSISDGIRQALKSLARADEPIDRARTTRRTRQGRNPMNQQVRFCTSSDGFRLAYATSGTGPPIVRAPHWFSHLEHDWNNPAMMPWSAGLSRGYSLLRFDQRGTGLSDRDAPIASWNATS